MAARFVCARRHGTTPTLWSAFSPSSLTRASICASTAVPPVDAHLVAPDLEPDWAERGALIGAVATDDGERLVALASYARLRDREAAEVAFAVADGYPGRGVGTRLLERLAARASEQGITRFVAEVMAENEPMLHVFSEAGFSRLANPHRW